MPKILLGGAGGAPTENVIMSLNKETEELVGIGSEVYDLALSSTRRKYLVPYACSPKYKARLFEVLKMEKPDFAHFQNDLEIREISEMRDEIERLGTRLYMPSKETIRRCVDKSITADLWSKAGLTIPQTIRINNQNDLKTAFEKLGDETGTIWLRSTIGGGGRGALPTNDYQFACKWIDRFGGWGEFTGAQILTENSITWLSLWYEGELVAAQTRRRKSWNFGNRTLSGVTGITKVGETCSDPVVDETALAAIYAIDRDPHGIYGVDMTYDRQGNPNPTEINIARFFTTVYFFTAAGLNFPKIYKDIALYKKFPSLEKRINPLPNGLLWLRGMDRMPLLTTEEAIKREINMNE